VPGLLVDPALATGSPVDPSPSVDREVGGVLETAERFRLLYDLGCAFAARIELDQLVMEIATRCRDILRATGCSVLLLDPETNELYFPYTAERDPAAAAQLLRLRFPADRGIAGSVMKSGKAVRVDDVTADVRFYSEIDRGTGTTTRNILCAPLMSHQGTIGVVQVVNRRDGKHFDEDDLAFLDALAGSIAVAIENARLYAQVKDSEGRLRAEVGALRRDIARRDRFTEIIGMGPAMAHVFGLMESAAASSIVVLIEGETGTGKELVARGIHGASDRAQGPFLAVNCAAVPEALLESHLFGHRRGAFTGAMRDQRGMFEAASGGTIFLDEVSEMPTAMQAKLLRVLQENEITPIGDTHPRKVDVRVISATNRELHAAVEQGRFRNDLYYRLAAFPIRLPPLREHQEDIPLLASRFLQSAAARYAKQVREIHPAALDRLTRFEWPGNVRELQNEMERAVVLAQDGDSIRIEHLSPKIVGEASTVEASALCFPREGDPYPVPLRDARTAFEARHIASVLEQNARNVSHTARALGVSRVMLQKKMKHYGLRGEKK
jgi:Nif-specific regulatory protein